MQGATPTNTLRMLLLAGGLKRFPLADAADCAIIDLLLTPEKTPLDLWIDHARALEGALGALCEISVVYGGASHAPRDWASGRTDVAFVADPSAIRGPAGIARDLCESDAPDAQVVVIEAKRCLTTPLTPMVRGHIEGNRDVTVAANPDGSPAGIYLIRRRALDLMNATGFVDLKEQWLKRVIAEGLEVRVHTLLGRGALPLRTREQFLEAAMSLAGFCEGGRSKRFLVFGSERATPEEVFRVVHPRASIGPGAIVEDSIVMEGCQVGAGAVVKRSILAPGAAVEQEAEVVDAVVNSRGVVSEVGGRQGPGRQRTARR